jgi:rhodanese-related sulfurtransferase
LAKAQAAAERVAQRFGVKFADAGRVQAWLHDPQRTTYLLDVRTREEFEAGHVAGSRHAPGGQLVQATDEYVAVRQARLVLIDPQRVRAVMTASWLNQMGWHDVYVLGSLAGLDIETGPRKPPFKFKPWAITTQLGGTVLDFSTSLRFHHQHLPGAWWVVRSRLKEAREKIGDHRVLLLTSEDAVLAHLAAPEVAALWPKAQVRVLDGGNAASKGPWESGSERASTTRDDVWYKPYDHAAGFEQHARDYLAWEVALIEQIKRDPTIRFQKF